MDQLERVDRYSRNFLINLAIIVLIGVTMVYSSSYIYAREVYHSSSYFFLRQLCFLLIGLSLAFTAYRVKFSFWMKFAYYFHVLCCFLLLLTVVPGVSINIKGATRWLSLGIFKFQPGELVKYSITLCSLYFFEMFEHLNRNQKIKFGVSLGLPLLLFLLQPDFGSFTICFLSISFVCFLSSFPRKYFYSFLGGGTVIGITLLFTQSYRIMRIMTFLDPWKNPKTTGFQIIQSYLAFANGSWFGQGLGNSNEKLFYLPEAHNDFIFSVIGEELGFFGVMILAILFLFLIYFGLKMAVTIQNRMVMILVASIIFLIGLQATLNMGVVLGLLPTKGLNLPFISYGGSSLISNCFGIGLLFSAIRFWKIQQEQVQGQYDF